MLKYNDLTKAQKRWVDAMIELDPSLASGGTVTLKGCAHAYNELRAKRKGDKGEKIGYPNWLYASNKISRGVYEFPAPNAKSTKAKVANDKTKLEKIIAESDPVVVESQSDAEFLQELRDNGIAV
jgi:hypothetical protein